MSRKGFSELLKKYLNGECTPDEKQFIEHWYATLDSDEENPSLIESEILEERLWEEIESKMHETTVENVAQPKVIKWKKLTWVSIAASVLLVGTWLFFSKSFSSNPNTASSEILQDDWIEQKNTSTGTITVQLEDGSIVKLSPKSNLRFPKKFETLKREVYLDGNGFFDIKKEPNRPFFVYANDVVTKVLGTSFFIRTEEKTKEVKVEVVTGRVVVYRKPKENETKTTGVMLTPNHAATYFNDQQHFVTSLVENPTIIPLKAEEDKAYDLKFDDTPIQEVLDKLESAYGIDFTVENDKQYNCLLTANLNNQNLNTQLELICAALHYKYEVQGTTIILSGKGCN